MLLHPQLLLPVQSHIVKDATLATWCGSKGPSKADFVVPSGSVITACIFFSENLRDELGRGEKGKRKIFKT